MRIFIASDNSEHFAAAAIKDFLGCRTTLAVQTTLDLDPHLLEAGDIVLLLCSQFSIRNSPYLHGVAGLIDSKNLRFIGESGQEKRIHVVPICFSGLTSSELPAYISANHGIVLDFEDNVNRSNSSALNGVRDRIDFFGDVLCKTINRHSGYSAITDTSKDASESFFNFWDERWELYMNNLDQTIQESNNNALISNATPIKITRKSREESSVVEASLEYCTSISSPREWIDEVSSVIKITGLESSEFLGFANIGIQPFIWDGENFYLGLKKSQSDLFQFGESSKSNIDGLTEICDRLEFETVSPSCLEVSNNAIFNRFHNYIKVRLNSCGHTLWRLRLPGFLHPEFCMIMPNDSDEQPRLDIGIIRLLDYSNLVNKDGNGSIDFSAISLEKKLSICDDFAEEWIWVKDGRIRYWHYKSFSDIESFLHPHDTSFNVGNSIFVNDIYLFRNHGVCRAVTPYTSDEDGYKKYDIPFKGKCSTYARAVLICF